MQHPARCCFGMGAAISRMQINLAKANNSFCAAEEGQGFSDSCSELENVQAFESNWPPPVHSYLRLSCSCNPRGR